MKQVARGGGEACPYFSSKIGVCLASLFLMAIDKSRGEGLCAQEGWDDCPMFLSKTLRNKN